MALIGAAGLVVLVFVSTERARLAPTALGTALGLQPLQPRLAAIADMIAVSHRQPDVAQLAFARRAAVAAPLDALPYYIAGATRPASDAPASRTLIAMALQRDPRLRPAWSWTVADRAKANDIPPLTRALVRLAVLNPDNEQLWPAIAQLSADPTARRTLIDQLRRGAPWRDRYLAALSASPVNRAVVFEMLQSVGQHKPVTATPAAGSPDDKHAFIAALIARKEYERAYLAWVQWLPAASQDAVGHVFDGGFKGRASLPPFAWQLGDGSGGAVSIDPAAGLTLDYAAEDAAVVAQQMVLLPPGRYRVLTQARFDAVSSDGALAPLVWNVTCVRDNRMLVELAVPLDGAERRVGGVPFDVPAGCDAQLLSLKVNPVDFAKRLSGHIRSVAVETVK